MNCVALTIIEIHSTTEITIMNNCSKDVRIDRVRNSYPCSPGKSWISHHLRGRFVSFSSLCNFLETCPMIIRDFMFYFCNALWKISLNTTEPTILRQKIILIHSLPFISKSCWQVHCSDQFCFFTSFMKNQI